jgi:preprotein translocase subunit SecA
VVIVDEFTGRPCPERSWSDGIHQAVEAEAGVVITEENASEVAITRPAYFSLYKTRCGMTGTASEAAGEIRASYGMQTVVIPLNKPSKRQLLPDRIFATHAVKMEAVANDIAQRVAAGQPVLVGSRTVANSEAMALTLARHGIAFYLLNAKQDAAEAEIIEKAGAKGRVTIATNMAGRGAHIPLDEVAQEAGGLHVICLERHETRRVDRQLVGRSARQGQPGSAQFFLSLEDELLVHHASRVAKRLARAAETGSGELPSNFGRYFLQAQRRAEMLDRESRQQLARYNSSLNELKEAI